MNLKIKHGWLQWLLSIFKSRVKMTVEQQIWTKSLANGREDRLEGIVVQ